MRLWPRVRGIERASAEDLEYLERLAADCGFDPDEIATIISLESGWNPAAHNDMRAGGLIGFLPSTLQGLGWTGSPEEFWRLSIAEQLPWVDKYYRRWCGRISRPGDLYVATFWPAAVGTPDDYVISGRQGPYVKVWEQNPGLREGEVITAGSVRRVVLRALERARAKQAYVPGTTSALTVGTVLAILVGVLIWQVVRRRTARASSGA